MSEKKGENNSNPHVRLDWAMIDSAAFKMLSPNSVWVFIMLLRQFKTKTGGYSHLILPFEDVKWKLSFQAFKKAILELVDNKFIVVVKHGDIHAESGKATVYSAGMGTGLSTRWKERSREIFEDQELGKLVWRLRPDEDGRVRKVSAWIPMRKAAEYKQTNLMKARKALKHERSRRDSYSHLITSRMRDPMNRESKV